MRASRLLLVLVGAVLTLVVGAGPASAHDALRGTSPADGAHVGPVPAAVVLTFDQPALAMGTQIVVTGPSGNVSTGAPRLVDETVTQDLAPAPAGTYTVAWRVTSADGHPVSGTFTFVATSAGGGPGKQGVPVTATQTPDPAGRRLALLVGVPVAVLALAAVAVVALRRRPD